MKTINIDIYDQHKLKDLVSPIEFFDILAHDNTQLETILKYARIIEAAPGDTIMRKGDMDSSIYFVLQGQLLVYLEHADGKERVINYLSAGEEFGSLAVLRDTERTATIVASAIHEKCIILGIDTAIFGEIDDFSAVSIATKIKFYETLSKVNRWRLNFYKDSYPNFQIIKQINALPPFKGNQGTVEELRYRFGEAKALATLLHRWNRSLESLPDLHPLSRYNADWNPCIKKAS